MIRTTVIFLAFSTISALPAAAAPQVLAVLSTGNGAAMKCENGECTASLSSYCLQQNRSEPDMGAPYHAANPTSFTLVLEMSDGSQKSVIAPDMMTYRAERGYKSVEAVVAENFLRQQGAVSARVMVGPKASLIPDPDEDDLNPLTEAEIALAIGPSRIMGSLIVDTTEDAKAARALAVMLRGIPDWQGWPTTSRGDLWGMIDNVAQLENVVGDDYSLIESEFKTCADSYESSEYYGIGYCLRKRHDDELLKLNKQYWNFQAGS